MPRPALAIRQMALVVLLAAVGAPSYAANSAWADPAKILHVTMDGGEAGFDPQAVGDTYSFTVISAIFEQLYQYDYLGGSQIVPKVAAAMPEISPDGRTWTIRLKPKVFFADDPAYSARVESFDLSSSSRRGLTPLFQLERCDG